MRTDFRYFLLSRALAALAVQAASVTLGWQVYDLGRTTRSVAESTFLVGMVGLVQFVPLFLLTLVAGAVADRHDRRVLVLLGTALEIACVGALAFLPHPGLPLLFGIAALSGVARAFLSPAGGALGPMLVPREDLPKALPALQLADQAATIVGPWVGGALTTWSTRAAYVGAALLFAASAAALLAIRAETRPARTEASQWALVREGLAYVFTNRVVLGAISLDLFAVLLGGATALLPVFARDVLHVGATGYGALRSGPAIGATLMAAALGCWPIVRRAGRWLFGGVAGFGLFTLVFAVSRSLPLSVVALAALGAADMISVTVRHSLIQLTTPDALRGRVTAVAHLFIGASNELGEFETGAVGRFFGPVGAAIFGGVGTLAVAGVWARLFPELRNSDRLS